MFQNVLMTAFTPLCKTNEIHSWENRPFTTIWPEPQQQNKGKETVTKTIKKKAKRNRTAYTEEQLRTLEKTFALYKYIDSETRKELASRLKVGEKSVKIWFQNRRMKVKRESESSFDSSSNSSSTAASPPLIVQNGEIADETVKVEDSNQFHIGVQDGNYEVPPCELPQYQYYPQYYEYATPNMMQPNSFFCRDTNVYPTQYYPIGTEYHQEQCPQYDNSWPTNMFDMGYY